MDAHIRHLECSFDFSDFVGGPADIILGIQRIHNVESGSRLPFLNEKKRTLYMISISMFPW